MTQKVATLLSTSFKVASNRTVDHEQLCEVGYFFIPFINKYAGEDDEYFIEQENKRGMSSATSFGSIVSQTDLIRISCSGRFSAVLASSMLVSPLSVIISLICHTTQPKNEILVNKII